MHPTIPVMPSYLFSILIEAPSPFLFGTFVEAYSSLVTRIPDYVRVVRVGREFKEHFDCPPEPYRRLYDFAPSLSVDLKGFNVWTHTSPFLPFLLKHSSTSAVLLQNSSPILRPTCMSFWATSPSSTRRYTYRTRFFPCTVTSTSK